jgi:hypothetical protein
MENFITSTQAAEMLGVTVTRISQLCRGGELAGAKQELVMGGRRYWLIPKEAVQARLDKQKNNGKKNSRLD